MGNSLPEPNKAKMTEKGSFSGYEYAASSAQGWRLSMEDAHVVKPFLSSASGSTIEAAHMFAVFDGHGGGEVSKFIKNRVVDVFVNTKEFIDGDLPNALKTTFLKMDELLYEEKNSAELKGYRRQGIIYQFLCLDVVIKSGRQNGYTLQQLQDVLNQANFFQVRLPVDKQLIACLEELEKKRMDNTSKSKFPQFMSSSGQGPKNRQPLIYPDPDAPLQHMNPIEIVVDLGESQKEDDPLDDELPEPESLPPPVSARVKSKPKDDLDDMDKFVDDVEAKMRQKKGKTPKPAPPPLSPEPSTEQPAVTEESSNVVHSDEPMEMKGAKFMLSSGIQSPPPAAFSLGDDESKRTVSMSFKIKQNDRNEPEIEVQLNTTEDPKQSDDDEPSAKAPETFGSIERLEEDLRGNVEQKPGAGKNISVRIKSKSQLQEIGASKEKEAEDSVGAEETQPIHPGSGQTKKKKMDKFAQGLTMKRKRKKHKQKVEFDQEEVFSNSDIAHSSPSTIVEPKRLPRTDADAPPSPYARKPETEETEGDVEQAVEVDKEAEQKELINKELLHQLKTLVSFPTNAGSTVNCVLIEENNLYCANIGDSRAVLCRNGAAFPLSFDHKPNNPSEKLRITGAGGKISNFGRINNDLNLSRSVGDLRFKQNKNLPPERQMVSAEAEIKSTKILAHDLFLVLACDGIWDVMNNQDVCNAVLNMLHADKTVSEIAEALIDRCIAADLVRTKGLGGDNMTVVVVLLKEISEIKKFSVKRENGFSKLFRKVFS